MIVGLDGKPLVAPPRRKRVRFLRRMGAYNAGEVAEFEAWVADEQIALGISEEVVERGDDDEEIS